MSNQPRRIRVKGVIEQSPEESIRKVARAVIALARAQLEAEAQADHALRKQKGDKRAKSSGDAA